MHFLIYKTTNLINGKFYIGKHQTKDVNDGYVGSGKLLKRAIKKYGSDQFKTEILETCPTEAHMNLAEKIYVVIDSEISYNLCSGGKGGFGYINENNLNNNKKDKEEIYKRVSASNKLFYNQPDIKKARSLKTKEAYESGKRKPIESFKGAFKGHKHTEETKQQIKLTKKLNGSSCGERNSQYGKPRSEETKKKISESMRRRKLNSTMECN